MMNPVSQKILFHKQYIHYISHCSNWPFPTFPIHEAYRKLSSHLMFFIGGLLYSLEELCYWDAASLSSRCASIKLLPLLGLIF